MVYHVLDVRRLCASGGSVYGHRVGPVQQAGIRARSDSRPHSNRAAVKPDDRTEVARRHRSALAQ